MNISSPRLDSRRGYLQPMIIMPVQFFMFGFVTWLNGILIPI